MALYHFNKLPLKRFKVMALNNTQDILINKEDSPD